MLATKYAEVVSAGDSTDLTEIIDASRRDVRGASARGSSMALASQRRNQAASGCRMRTALGITASTILLIAAHASAQPVVNISCKATHSVGCEGATCSSEAPGEGEDIFVGFELSTVSGRGNLCTYTYCRDFVLVPLPGDSLDEALKKLSGFTLSNSRGSAVDDLERPAIDYQLSISEDRRRFFLGNLADGGFGGWAGTCSTTP